MKEKVLTKLEKYLSKISMTKEEYNDLVDLFKDKVKEEDAKELGFIIDSYELIGYYDYSNVKTLEDIINGRKSDKKSDSKDEPKKVEPKKVEPKKVEPKKEEPKKVEPKKVEPKKEEPKKVEPKKEEPKKDEPKKVEPKKEEPKKDEPKKVEPKKVEPKKVEPKKDESKKEITNIRDLFNEIVRLNKDVDLVIDKEAGSYVIYSSVDGKDLKLPENFYYNDKNGITNKHNTESGAYINVMVEPLAKKAETKKDEPKKTEPKKEIKTNKDLFDELVRLNPDANLRSEEKEGVYRIYSSSSINFKDLKLPDGFAYDETKGIFRVDSSTSGKDKKPAKDEPKKTEPKKEIKTTKDLFEAIVKLNKDVKLELKVEGGFGVIYSSVDGKDLKLPDGFDYNDKNGITNKHKTSDAYISIKVRKITKDVSKKPVTKAKPKKIGPFKKFYYNNIKKYKTVDDKLNKFEVRKVDFKKRFRFGVDKKLRKILNFIDTYYSDNDEIYGFMDLLEEREDRNAIIRKLYRFIKHSLKAYEEDKFVDKLYELFGLTRKKEEPKKTEPKKEEPKKVEPKKVEPKKTEVKKVTRNITEMSEKYKKIMSGFRATFTEQEIMFVDDAASECLQFGDQEFEQMLNQRCVDKIRVYNCMLGMEKIKLLNAYDNLTSYEKMFVDDAIAEGLNPGNPEFDQMVGERSIDKEIVTKYFKLYTKANEVQNKIVSRCKKDFLKPDNHSHEEIKKYATENATDLGIFNPNILTVEELNKVKHKLNVLKEQELEKKLGLRK